VSELVKKQAVPDIQLVDILYNVAASAVTTTALSTSRDVLPQMVSEDRLKVKVAYRIALAVGQKMHGITIKSQYVASMLVKAHVRPSRSRRR
jgi:hypothetical protein